MRLAGNALSRVFNHISACFVSPAALATAAVHQLLIPAWFSAAR